MVINYEKGSVMFVIKEVVTLVSIQMMSNKRSKNSGNETKNFGKINANTTYF